MWYMGSCEGEGRDREMGKLSLVSYYIFFIILQCDIPLGRCIFNNLLKANLYNIMSQVSVALKIYGSHPNANGHVCRKRSQVKILRCDNMIMKAIYPKRLTRLESFSFPPFSIVGDYICSVTRELAWNAIKCVKKTLKFWTHHVE